MYAFAIELVVGYEYHDDYVETQRVTLTTDAWSFGTAEEDANDLANMLIAYEDDGWWRVESIERVRMA